MNKTCKKFSNKKKKKTCKEKKKKIMKLNREKGKPLSNSLSRLGKRLKPNMSPIIFSFLKNSFWTKKLFLASFTVLGFVLKHRAYTIRHTHTHISFH